MKKLLSAFVGAVLIGVVAASAQAAPVEPAVFHPGLNEASVQTVQYRSNFHDRPRHFYRRGYERHRHYRPHYSNHRYYHGPYRRY